MPTIGPAHSNDAEVAAATWWASRDSIPRPPVDADALHRGASPLGPERDVRGFDPAGPIEGGDALRTRGLAVVVLAGTLVVVMAPREGSAQVRAAGGVTIFDERNCPGNANSPKVTVPFSLGVTRLEDPGLRD